MANRAEELADGLDAEWARLAPRHHHERQVEVQSEVRIPQVALPDNVLDDAIEGLGGDILLRIIHHVRLLVGLHRCQDTSLNYRSLLFDMDCCIELEHDVD